MTRLLALAASICLLLTASVVAQERVWDADTVRVDVRIQGSATAYSINEQVVLRSRNLLDAFAKVRGRPEQQKVEVFLHSLDFRFRDISQLGAVLGKVGYAAERYFIPCERHNQPRWCEVAINEPELPR